MFEKIATVFYKNLFATRKGNYKIESHLDKTFWSVVLQTNKKPENNDKIESLFSI